MSMHDSAHPGELLTGWLDDLGVSVTAFAAHIGISRVMLSRVMHCHAAVSADTRLTRSGCCRVPTFGQQNQFDR